LRYPFPVPAGMSVGLFTEPDAANRPRIDRQRIIDEAKQAAHGLNKDGEGSVSAQEVPSDLFKKLFRVAFGYKADGNIALVVNPIVPTDIPFSDIERKPYAHPCKDECDMYVCALVSYKNTVQAEFMFQSGVPLPDMALHHIVRALSDVVMKLYAIVKRYDDAQMQLKFMVYFNDYDKFIDKDKVRTHFSGAFCFDYDYFAHMSTPNDDFDPADRKDVHKMVCKLYADDVRPWLINSATGAERIPAHLDIMRMFP